MTTQSLPHLGFGLGLRTPHYQTIIETQPAIDWFEVISENYLIPGGKPLYFLEKIRQDYPMVMHGVSMSIGSSDPINYDYLLQLKNLANKIEAHWISDHLCWTGIHGKNAHDLLPLPYSSEAINHVVSRIQQIQDFLGRQILIENVSSYVTFKDSEITEWEFINEILQQADCLLLLDVNNVYVSAFNHNFDATEYLNAIPAERIQQIHLAGHSHCGTHIIDTHDEPVVEEVWNLYRQVINRIGPTTTMIERDDNIPPLDELLNELNIARQLAQTSDAAA